MPKWHEYKLKDITSKIGSGATPTGGENAYKDTGISLIRSQNVYDFHFDRGGLAYIDDDQAVALKNVSVQENDILLNITGESVTRSCVVPKEYLPARVNQHVAIIRLIKDIADYRFVFYSLQVMKGELNSMAEIGCTRRALTKEMLDNLPINLPSLPEQRAIAAVLSSLDDKIDLLHRQNKTLESLAETIWWEIFVVDVKKEWERKRLSEIIDVRDGTHDSPKQTETGFYLITSRHLKKEGIDFANAYKISESNYHQINKRSGVAENDLLFSMIGTLGLIHYVDEKPVYAIKNMGLFKCSQKPEFAKYLYLLLKSPIGREYLYENTEGSTQEYISLGNLRALPVEYPGDANLKAFDAIIAPYFIKMRNNKHQIHMLSLMRDTLSQKLFSGEIGLLS